MQHVGGDPVRAGLLAKAPADYVAAVRELARHPDHPEYGAVFVTFRAVLDLLKGTAATDVREASYAVARMFPLALRDQDAQYDAAQDAQDAREGVHPVVSALRILATRLNLQAELEQRAETPAAPGRTYDDLMARIFDGSSLVWSDGLLVALWHAVVGPDPGHGKMPEFSPAYREAVLGLLLALDARGHVAQRVADLPVRAKIYSELQRMRDDPAMREIAAEALARWSPETGYKAPASAR